MNGGMDALAFFAHRIGERARARELAGLPPEPAPTREEVKGQLVEALTRPNALLQGLK